MSSHPSNRLAVAFIFVTVFLDMVGFGIVLPVLPRLIEAVSGADLSGASLLAGWLFFAYGGMQFLFGTVLGNLSDAYGRRPVLLLSVFGLAVDYLLTAFAPTMLWLFVGRTLAGLCGASYTTANAYLADITKPEERAKVFGYMGAASGLKFIARSKTL
jgi:MFS transporter, DHA1 family, tetracycline resistance protein